MDEISPEDRLAIEDALGRYLLAVDLGRFEDVVARFCSDAVIRYADGKRFEGTEGIATFARRAIAGPEARRRMHLCRSLFAERRGDAVLLRSYLVVPEAHGPTDAGEIRAMRYVEDTFRKVGGQWLVAERVIHPWPMAAADAGVAQ